MAQALHGMGGIGKTALAVEYAHRHRADYDVVWGSPASVHFGTAEQIRVQRQLTLDRAYATHPERFVRRPRPPRLPEIAWINQPTEQAQPVT